MLAYLRLQLLMKWRAYQPQSYRRENQSKARTAISYVGFALLALYLLGLVVWFELMLFDQFAAIGQADAIVALGFLACSALTLLYGFFSLAGQLFFGRDTGFISAMPISSRGVLTVKTAMAALSEAGVSLLFCGTLIIRLGIERGANALYYVKGFLACVFVPVIPLAAALLLSFALIRLSGLWKRREGLTTLFSFAFIIGIMVLSMNAQNMDSAELQGKLMALVMGQGSLAGMLLSNYPPLRWASDGLLTGGLVGAGSLLLFIVVSLAVIGLLVYLLGGKYLALASRQEETLRRINEGARKHSGRDQMRKPLWALFRQEVREVLTVPTYATNCLTGVIMYPLMMILVFVSMQNQFESGGMVRELYRLIPRDFYLAGAAGLMCIVNGMGMAISTAVSREGKRHDMRKTYPISGATHLMAKLLMGMMFNLLTAVTTMIVLAVMLPSFIGETLLALIIGQIFNFMWCSLALSIDVRHPRLQWKTETEAVKQNVNGMLSMLLSFGLMVLPVGLMVLCVKLGATVLLGLMAAIALIIAGAAASGWLLFKKSAITYYLQ